MHPEIERLLAIAKKSARLTERQREIILRKARELDADMDEVEFELEDLRVMEQERIVASARKEESSASQAAERPAPGGIKGFLLKCHLATDVSGKLKLTSLGRGIAIVIAVWAICFVGSFLFFSYW